MTESWRYPTEYLGATYRKHLYGQRVFSSLGCDANTQVAKLHAVTGTRNNWRIIGIGRILLSHVLRRSRAASRYLPTYLPIYLPTYLPAYECDGAGAGHRSIIEAGGMFVNRAATGSGEPLLH